jgi:hypothetical protein
MQRSCVNPPARDVQGTKEDAMPTCMICNRPGNAAADGESVYVCERCEQSHAHLLDDDDDVDGRAESRHLTILTIDIDE